MPLQKTGATHYHSQLGLLGKGREIKGCLQRLGSRAC